MAAIFASIIKSDRRPDGTLDVTGVVSDETLDVDEQIADNGWLKRALPEWFKWGNIREQHGATAAGVATEYQHTEGSNHTITAHVVDKGTVAKVEAGVLKGFSIGIRSPRVVSDKAARGGRIVDGQIVEVSLVDRPANPSCTFTMVKSAFAGWEGQMSDLDATRGLVRVAEWDKSTAAELTKADAGAKDDKDPGANGADDDNDANDDAAETGNDTTDPDDNDPEGPDDDDDGKPAKKSANLVLAKLDSLITVVGLLSDQLALTTKATGVLETRLAEVEGQPAGMPARTGINKTAKPDTVALEAARLVRHYQTLADSTTDNILRAGYLELARRSA